MELRYGARNPSRCMVRRIERIQRRASKFILKLPYMCTETYNERLATLMLMLLSYWHEYMDLVFFFNAVNGSVYISEDILPKPINPARVTRSSTTNVTKFRPRKCKTVTFQCSFFNRVTRIWNTLPSNFTENNVTLNQFKNLLRTLKDLLQP